jgi:hypothetical protein
VTFSSKAAVSLGGTVFAVAYPEMAILQAILALVTRSAGKILNAVFGWAVHALFGKTAARDETLLSALVAAAAAWPLLVAGIVAPKVAAFVLAFVPLPSSVPSWVVRIVWSVLALAVPVTLGLTLAARGPKKMQSDPIWKRVLRGFPLTLGLAAAFLVMFVTVPILRLISLIRREKSADIPLVTDVDAYHQTAARLVEALNAHGFELHPAEPGWWTKAPTRILSLMGGQAFAGFVPQRIEYYEGPAISLSFYTSGILLRGKGQRLTWAHGLIIETAAQSAGLQTFAPKAQETERRLRDIWRALEADAKPQSQAKPRSEDSYLVATVQDLARGLSKLDVPYDDWQALYRQLLQLERAVRGQAQLLDDNTGTKTPVPHREEAMASAPPTKHPPATPSRPVSTTLIGTGNLSTPQILAEISRETQQLMKTHVELVKAEMRADLSREISMLKGFGVSALAALAGLNLLLVSGVLGLAQTMPAWQAGLLATTVVWLLGAGIALYSWKLRVRKPLEKTRHAAEQDVRWMKERLT